MNMAALRRSASSPSDLSIPIDRLWRISVEKYHQMIATGALTESDPVELLEGLLVSKMSRDPQHDGTLHQLLNLLTRALPDQWSARVQSAVTTQDSEPEPDLAVVVAPISTYCTRHPGRDDIGLVVEVANTSLTEDRTIKARVYARERFPIYWIVNLPERLVEVHSSPRGGKLARYQDVATFGEAEKVPVILKGEKLASLRVREILPAREQ